MEIAALVGCRPVTKRNWITHEGCVYSRVRDVASIEPDPFVFDLKVEGDETYMTNAALVHNGGKRKGSGCAYLESWHNDIFEFLELRKNTGDDRRRTHDMNTANWIPDLFMKRMEARESWTLFRSNEVPDLHESYGRKFEELYLKYEKTGRGGQDLRAQDRGPRPLEEDAFDDLRDGASLDHVQGPVQRALARRTTSASCTRPTYAPRSP